MLYLMQLRKSRDRREQSDPEALSRHRAILHDLAAADGVVIAPEHVFEEVQSGEKLARRPEMQRLLTIIGKLPDCGRDVTQATVYCIEPDRISRGMLKEQGEIQEAFITKGVVLRSPEGVTDIRDHNQRLMYGMRGLLANWEVGQYKARVLRTREQQLRDGEVRYGRVPWGYLYDRNCKKPVPHPTDFPLLCAACEDAFTMSMRQLEAKYHVSWDRIHRALTNPMICGWPAKTHIGATEARGSHKLPRSQWVWPDEEGTYIKAMTRERWEQLWDALERRSKGGWKARGDAGWCRDVLRFKDWPGRIVMGETRQRGEWVPVYVCKRDDGRRVYAFVQEVHTVARLAVWQAIDNPAVIAKALSRETDPKVSEECDTIRGEIANLECRLDALVYEAAGAEPERRASIRRVEERIEKEIGTLRRRLQAVQRQGPDLSRAEHNELAESAAWIRNFEGWWDDEGLSDRTRAMWARWLLEYVEVTVHPAKRGLPCQRTVTSKPKDWVLDFC